MNIRLWGILFILLAALGGVSYLLSKQQTKGEQVALQRPTEEQMNKFIQGPQQVKLKNATREPGRVVVLETSRGRIEFVLYEKDCPRTTSRIAELVQSGAYNGVSWPRVESWVIQTAPAKKEVPTIGLELTKGLSHERGTVGMARASDPNSATSVFYITLESTPQLDSGYTNFGRVIRGMDVITRIKLNDKIKSATLRPSTAADKQILQKLLKADGLR